MEIIQIADQPFQKKLNLRLIKENLTELNQELEKEYKEKVSRGYMSSYE